MKNLHISKYYFLAIVLAMISCGTIQGDKEKGAALYESCASCHGKKAQGLASMKTPTLAGQKEIYLRQALQEFISGTRGQQAKTEAARGMRRSAIKMLPNQDAINDVSAYIASLKYVSSAPTFDTDHTQGKELYTENNCITCHDANGIGNASVPRIAGLADWYIHKQLLSFAKSSRGDPSLIKAHNITQQGKPVSTDTMRRLSAYITSLK